MGKDFGYFGDGLEGYVHYKQSFDENFPQQTADETNFDSDGYTDENISEDEDSFNDSPFDEEESIACDENSAGGFTLSFRQPVSAAELVHRDVAAVKSYEDLSIRYKFNDKAYDFRWALLEYFPEIRESYEHSPEIEYEDILAQVLLIDFDLGYRAWRWMLEHFQRCLTEKFPSWELCVGVLYRMNCELHLPMAKKLGADEEMLCWVFSKCFDFGRGQYDLLCACLAANDSVLFDKLLQYYIVRKDWLADGSAHFDTVIEECLPYADVSKENYEILEKYVQMSAVGLRRKYLEKRLLENKPEE